MDPLVDAALARLRYSLEHVTSDAERLIVRREICQAAIELAHLEPAIRLSIEPSEHVGKSTLAQWLREAKDTVDRVRELLPELEESNEPAQSARHSGVIDRIKEVVA